MGVGEKNAVGFRGGWLESRICQEKKRYNKQRLVLEYLVKNRRQGVISTIHEHYWDKIEIADVEGGVDTMYCLDQREVVHHFFSKWAGQEDLVTTNDKFRVAGLITLECNRDQTVVYVNSYTKSSEVFDNPVSIFYFCQYQFYISILTLYFILFLFRFIRMNTFVVVLPPNLIVIL